jgi:hypothetical protein
VYLAKVEKPNKAIAQLSLNEMRCVLIKTGVPPTCSVPNHQPQKLTATSAKNNSQQSIGGNRNAGHFFENIPWPQKNRVL